jgi:hypothetical protein
MTREIPGMYWGKLGLTLFLEFGLAADVLQTMKKISISLYSQTTRHQLAHNTVLIG